MALVRQRTKAIMYEPEGEVSPSLQMSPRLHVEPGWGVWGVPGDIRGKRLCKVTGGPVENVFTCLAPASRVERDRRLFIPSS